MLFEFTKEIGGKRFDFCVKASEPKVAKTSWKYGADEITINGEQIKKEPNEYEPDKPYYSASFKEQYIKTYDNKALCLEVRGNTKKQICKILGLKIKEDTLNIVMREFQDVWESMKAEAEALMEKLATEEQAKIDAEYEDDNMEIEIHNHSSYGFGSYGYGKSTRGKNHIEMTKSIRGLGEALEEYLDHSDWGDYSVSTYYKLSIKEFEKIVSELAEKARIENKQREKAEAIRQKEIDARRATMKVEILKEGRVDGGDGPDFYAEVEITDLASGETKRFNCRNLFDVGYVINPMYPVAEGARGGIEMNGYWDTGVGDENRKIKITEVERRMLDYLYEFSPVDTGIRM